MEPFTGRHNIKILNINIKLNIKNKKTKTPEHYTNQVKSANIDEKT